VERESNDVMCSSELRLLGVLSSENTVGGGERVFMFDWNVAGISSVETRRIRGWIPCGAMLMLDLTARSHKTGTRPTLVRHRRSQGLKRISQRRA
jgi:hypothetical protein